MKGVWPSWVMQSSLSPVQSPMPSNTAKAAGDPSVQVLHSARIDVSLVGSKVVMIGLIFRPLIPPAVVDLLDEELDGLGLLSELGVLGESLLSGQRVEGHHREDDIDGRCVVTPRDEVLAELTGEGPAVEASPSLQRSKSTTLTETASNSQAAVPTMTAPTTTVRIRMERGRRTVPSS